MAKDINNYNMSHGGGGEEREKKEERKKGNDEERRRQREGGEIDSQTLIYSLPVDMTSERKRSL